MPGKTSSDAAMVRADQVQRLDWQLFALLQAAIWESTQCGFRVIEPLLNLEMEAFYTDYKANRPFHAARLALNKSMLANELLPEKIDLAHQLASELVTTYYFELDLSLADVKAILKVFFPTKESLDILNKQLIEDTKNVFCENGKFTLKTIMPNKNILEEAKVALLNEYALIEEKNKIIKQIHLQQIERRRKAILVILAAIFFTPFSLLFTLPFWFKAKREEKIQKVDISREASEQVKEKRRALRGHDVKEDNSEKPKKVIIRGELYMDKAQLYRFNLFANQPLWQLQKNKAQINEMVRQSKQESMQIRKSF